MLTFMWQNDTGIYLLYNGVCVAENTFLQARKIARQSNGGPGLLRNGLYCFLAGSDNTNVFTNAQVKWLYPNGNHVDCSSQLANTHAFIGCLNAGNGAILYTSNFADDRPPEYSGVYTCCLLGNCFVGSSNSISVRIFGQC